MSVNARRAIGNDTNQVLVSAATAWEIATKHRLGKLAAAAAVAQDVTGAIASQGFEELAITVDDAQRAGQLHGPHRDPFDRMLVAQAIVRNLALVSADAALDRYAINRLW